MRTQLKIPKVQKSISRSTEDDSTSPSESRQAILAIAAELFAAHGFSKVSIRDIARQANVSVSTVMYHARSKEELLESCLEVTFSADSRLSELVEYIGSVKVTSADEFFDLYDRFIEIAVRQVSQFPMACRLWWRLLLDHESLFNKLEGELHRKLFANCNRLVAHVREAGLIRNDLVDSCFFLASLDSMIDGYFVGGLILTDGTRTPPGCKKSLKDFEKWLKQFGRLILAKP